MLTTPCYIVGDAHLGIAPHDAEVELLAFLRWLPGRGRSLVIMGDLFDFWFAWEHVMPRTGFRILAQIADLVEGGMEVLWIGGNHDCWGGEQLSEDTGATYTLEGWSGYIGNWKTELAHGDGLRDKEDAAYRRLRRVLRHPLAIRAYGWLHPDFASRLALASSDTSRDRREGDAGRGLLELGRQSLEAPSGPQLVVHGHSHVARLEQVGRGWYANPGAWYLDRQFLVVDNERITRLHWNSSTETNVLNFGNRPSQEALPQGEEVIGRV